MANLGPNFYPKLVQISSELGMRPEDLLVVMVSESGLNPGAVEQKFKGSGLVGFMPDTLKGLGYHGSWKEFSQLSGEDQLDYVKKLVQNNMKMNGGPFTSAAQYYVGNLWPIALKLPGIRQGDPSTAFIEENPQTTTDPKTGQKYSKKYYDLGFHISPKSESAAYKYNPLFHGSTPGAITYADMMKQADKIKRNPTYQKSLVAMRDSTGHQVQKDSPMTATKDDALRQYIERIKGKEDVYDRLSQVERPTVHTPPAGAPSGGKPADVTSILTNYLQHVTSSEKQNKKLYKKYLPINQIVIGIDTPNHTDAVEFARILCSTLDEELLSQSYTHTDGQKVEVECSIPGPEEECSEVVKQLSNAVSEAFHLATSKIGGIKVKIDCIMNKKSSYQQINFKSANLQHRKFLLKFI